MSIITCSACGAPAGAEQRFCGDCGSPMATGCPSCGTANPPGQRFCGSCGTKLDGAAPGALGGAAASAARATSAAGRDGGIGGGIGAGAASARPGGALATPTAERKLVSVLFADLVGFTPFAEGRDSEDVRDTLTRYFDLSTDVITRYGGTVEKFIGDAVMAVWGTPTTREDDAERAVRAALELVSAVGQLGAGIQARAGVLTGETAVTLGASNQGMVAGDLVNTAARLQAAAAPSTVLVGESTYRAASVAIAFESAGDQTLKGKATPVPAWRALRVVAERGGRNRAESLEAPFVGRDVELRLLKDLFHATGAERRVRHVSVVGTAGIGKSRLGWEFEKYLDGIDETVLWHHGRSPAYGQGVTFWSLGEMIRGRAGLLETDDQATTREKIAAMVDDVMPGHPNRGWVEKAMLQLLGIAGGVSSTELFGAWRAFFEALTARGTVVLVFQDVHWADSGTLDFIDHLVEWSREFPMFILSLARPELLDERPGWASARRSFTTVYLEPLSEAAIGELLTGLIPGLPDATIKAIVAQAEGVPLFAVEIVRMLVNSGELQAAEDGTLRLHGDVSKISVPETLTALIGARLDTLDPPDRALLLDAAVLGQSFTLEGVAAVSGRTAAEIEPRLEALTRRELLRHVADERSPERGQYAFMQALVRETAYNTLARKDRQTRHLAAARWFETLGEPELVGALAGHFLAARSLAPTGPEADALAAQARLALKAAGDRAASLGSNRQAIDFYQQALTVTVDDADEAEILELAGEIANRVTEFDAAAALLSRALEIHKAGGDRVAAARVAGQLGSVLVGSRRYEPAGKLLDESARDYADLGDARELLHIKSQQARLLMLTGQFAPVIPITDEVLLAAEHADHVAIIADTLVTRGTALCNLLRWREGMAVMDTAIEMASANGLTATWFRAINNVMGWRQHIDPTAAMQIAVEGLAVARRLGDERWTQGLGGQLAFVGIRTGDWDTVVLDLERMLATATDARTRANSVDNLASIRAVRGESIDEQLKELEATYALDQTDTSKVLLLDVGAWSHFGAGRLAEARDLMTQAYGVDPTIANSAGPILARIEIWAGDADAADRWQRIHWESVPHGGAAEADHLALTAAVRGLRGDRRGAAMDFREADRRYRELKLDIDAAIMAIDMAYVLGASDPFVVEAVSRARTTFATNHARTYLDQLEAALAHGAHAVVEAGGAAAPARVGRKATVPAP